MGSGEGDSASTEEVMGYEDPEQEPVSIPGEDLDKEAGPGGTAGTQDDATYPDSEEDVAVEGAAKGKIARGGGGGGWWGLLSVLVVLGAGGYVAYRRYFANARFVGRGWRPVPETEMGMLQ